MCTGPFYQLTAFRCVMYLRFIMSAIISINSLLVGLHCGLAANKPNISVFVFTGVRSQLLIMAVRMLRSMLADDTPKSAAIFG